jgi:hypothetical protein
MRTTERFLTLLALGTLVPLASCNDPLTVSIPDIVTPGQLSDSAALPTVRAGALGDFSIAYSGDHPDGSGGVAEGVIMYGGLLADEWINSETFPTRIEVDARNIHVTNADVDLWFRLMHRARASLENAASRYATAAPRDVGYPEMLALAGFTQLFFAETWCSGVPLSHVDAGGNLVYGQQLTTAQVLDTAVARFNAALAAPADTSSSADPAAQAQMVNLAKIGKARALLDAGDFAGADTAAGGVPTDFVYVSEHSENTTRENNGVFTGNVIDKRYSVGDREGGNANGFPFRTVVDPRTQAFLSGLGFDRKTAQYDMLRYGDRKTPITVATGVEARLIQAEAALHGGTDAQFLTQLNEPRLNPSERSYFEANASGATPIGTLRALTDSDETAAGGALKLLFNERARWLWLTAHRLGDMRRLIRQYGQAADSVFPSGAYFKSQIPNYGADVNFPIPVTEQNNPNLPSGAITCLDRNP